MRGVGVRRPEVVEVVARRPCAAPSGSALRFPAFSRSYKPLAASDQIEVALRAGQLPVHRPEAPALAGGGDRIDGEHVVHHVPVGDGARAAGVVARHAAERRLRAGRDVHREPEAVLAQLRVQRIEHHAGLHDRRCWPQVDLQHPVEILGVVDDERLADRLAALGAAGAARQDRDARPRPRWRSPRAPLLRCGAPRRRSAAIW